MKKRIAIIIERASVALGGAERSVFELAAALKAHGLEVDILAAKGKTDEENVHIICQDSPRKRASYFTFAKALKKYLSENHYNLMNTIAVKVWTEAGISSSLEPANLVFRINLQENCLGKERS